MKTIDDVMLGGTDIDAHVDRFYFAAARSQRIIECGVRDGNSTAVFLHGLPPIGGHLWSIDPIAPPGPLPDDPRWTFLLGRSLDRAVLDELPVEVDVVFLDSSVGYDEKIDELREYVPRLVPGGVLFVHDTEADFVREAVAAYCTEIGGTWVNDPQSHGLAVITR